eukprot:6356188-Amphidinium_carterae.2
MACKRLVPPGKSLLLAELVLDRQVELSFKFAEPLNLQLFGAALFPQVLSEPSLHDSAGQSCHPTRSQNNLCR